MLTLIMAVAVIFLVVWCVALAWQLLAAMFWLLLLPFRILGWLLVHPKILISMVGLILATHYIEQLLH